jgi:hypothetical protein
MMPSIATKFQYVNSLLFSFSLTACFSPYGPSYHILTSWIDAQQDTTPKGKNYTADYIPLINSALK